MTQRQSEAALTPSSRYLRTLNDTQAAIQYTSLKDPKVLLDLLERRAAHSVRHLANNLNNPDASAYQRVSRAVSEAFVAAQTLNSIEAVKANFVKGNSNLLINLFILVGYV